MEDVLLSLNEIYFIYTMSEVNLNWRIDTMNDFKQKQLLGMMQNLKLAAEKAKEFREYENNTSIDQYCLDLQKEGIELSEEMIVNKYNELKNFVKVNDYFYDKDETIWQKIENRRNLKFNSDSLIFFINKVIEKHFDTKTLLDPYYIENSMDYIEICPKEKIQEEIMNIIERLIDYANREHITKLDCLVDYYDVNEFMKYYIKRCHNRNRKFKVLIQRYYSTFEDADKSMYKIK